MERNDKVKEAGLASRSSLSFQVFPLRLKA